MPLVIANSTTLVIPHGILVRNQLALEEARNMTKIQTLRVQALGARPASP